MSKLLVFGHQNPDTDAITSAISYAYLLRHLGEDAEAVALGTPNEETQYALEYFKKTITVFLSLSIVKYFSSNSI